MRPWESVRRASRSAGTATVGWILRGPGFARTVSPGATLLLTPNARTGLPLRSKRACSKPRARAGPVDDPSLEDWWRPRAVAGRAVAARRQDGLPPRSKRSCSKARARAGPVDDPSLEDWWRPRAVAGRAVAARRQDGLPPRSKRPCSKARARAGPVDDRTSRVLPATGRRGKSCDGQTPGPGCRRARSGHARSLVLRPVPAMIRASRVGGGHGPPRKSSPVDGHRPRDWWVHGPSRVEWPDASWNRDGPERDTAESKRPTASC
jgi:hypothetical protein